MSLARTSDDPSYKQRYEDLALEFVQNAVGERDLDITARLGTNLTAAIPVRANRPKRDQCA
jgi:hypothetical protein